VSMDAANIHGTAIVVGKVGLLFLGPSGSGKSALAFACLASAKPLGLHATLIADDRVLLSRSESGILAKCPPSIAGLMEIRGTGIVQMAHTSSTLIDYAVLPGNPANAVRLPDDDEWVDVCDGIRLPVVRLLNTSINPLAIIMAKIPAQFD
jgi:serine kinase of HPr protein (carbohydrate metabolism regulator)